MTVIIGLGTDILAISRMEAAFSRRGLSLAQRLLHASEMPLWDAAGQSPRWLAKRFAAKEALFKALGTGLRKGVGWQDVAVTRDDLGKPCVVWFGEALRRLADLGNAVSWVSISDEQDYAIAFALIELQAERRAATPGQPVP